VNEAIATIIVAAITGTITLTVTFFTVRTQLKNDRERRKAEAVAAAEKAKSEKQARDRENEIDLVQLKRELETELWQRLQDDFREERDKRRELEHTVTEQGAEIIKLRLRVSTLEKDKAKLAEEKAVLAEEKEQWKTRALAAESKRGNGRNL
jgi:DNA repair exonuclease SbcCD ATPase subunit